MVNRQLRVWNCVLYPDNEKHLKAIEKARQIGHSVIMLHDRSLNPDGTIKKAHYHICFKFDMGCYLSNLLKILDLDETNAHLFKSLKEIGRKNRDEAIIYMSHILEDDKETYDVLEFDGADRDYAMRICQAVQKDPVEIYNEIVTFIMNTNDDHSIVYRNMSLGNIYLLLYDRFGKTVYKKWSPLERIIKDIQGW